MAAGSARDVVGVIDDDATVSTVICTMLRELAIEVRPYASALEFLEDPIGRRVCACLVLDVRLPGMSGVELQRRLVQEPNPPAIIFVTGYAEVAMAVETMQRGAVTLLEKPVRQQQLLDSVQLALALHRRSREEGDRNDLTTTRLADLTPREGEVLRGLLRGLRTREISTELGIAIRTTEEHRANLMHKMHAGTISELIVMCAPVPALVGPRTAPR
jgi:FixJ family two-component response regulator